uniref:uncharacterized protein LOC122585421 n=1 Tax=Erigeron canadensis TaxID=72917 RepID=UPI001CB930D2|nr:uncharacterized protein LOC122585421 [Erigeron canadensis]
MPTFSLIKIDQELRVDRKMEKEATTKTLPQKAKLKQQREVWDCESSLYDSFELKSFEKQLDSAISARTMSMPHLSSTSTRPRQPPPPTTNYDHKQQPAAASKKHSRLTRSLNKFLKSVFRPRNYTSSSSSSSRYEGMYGYDTSSALSTIPELPETTVPDFDRLSSEFDRLSPDMKSLVTRSRSDRFVMPTSVGVSCA